jgi:RNA polymerase sigma-70 factor, ECF subfamily
MSSQLPRGRRYEAVYATDDTLNPSVVQNAATDFDALFRAHYRRLCRVIYRVVGQTDLAEELAAEAFWKLHQRRPARLTNADAWLCRTGVRLALDALRKGRRRQRYESASPEPDGPPNPEEGLARAQDQERVRQVLAAMKPAQAALLLLRAEGLSYHELAAALELNPASVGTMIARAEARFKEDYETRYGHD